MKTWTDRLRNFQFTIFNSQFSIVAVLVIFGVVPATAEEPLYLITDYIPAALYDGENVTASFRIENTTGAPLKLEFTTVAYDSAGAVLAEKNESILAGNKGFTPVQINQSSRYCAKMNFALKRDAAIIAQLKLRLLRDEEPWPAAQFRNGRLHLAEAEEIVIPVVTRRLKSQDRAFAPVKWLMSNPPPAKVGKSLLFIPARWQAPFASSNESTFTVLNAYEPSLAAPVLDSVNDVLNRLAAQPAAAQIVICLPPEDLDVSTSARLYRIVLDALLVRLSAQPFKKIIIVPPFHYGANEAHSAALGREVNAACAVYGASAADPADWLNEELWRASPSQPGAYGIRPNATGLKKIEHALLNLVR